MGEPSAAKRRAHLGSLAKTLEVGHSKCGRLVRLIDAAAAQVDGLPQPAETLLNDLEKVLIGESLTRRGTGPYYAGFNRGASGFRRNLQDGSDQSAHAVAGIIIGYR